MRVLFLVVILCGLMGCGARESSYTVVKGTVSTPKSSYPLETTVLKFFRHNGKGRKFVSWTSPNSSGEFRVAVPYGEGEIIVQLQRGFREADLMIAGISTANTAHLDLVLNKRNQLLANKVAIDQFSFFRTIESLLFGEQEKVEPICRSPRKSFQKCYSSLTKRAVRLYSTQYPGEERKMAEFIGYLGCHTDPLVDWKPGLSEQQSCQAHVFYKNRADGNGTAIRKALESIEGPNPIC